jgi:hypothetical protein
MGMSLAAPKRVFAAFKLRFTEKVSFRERQRGTLMWCGISGPNDNFKSFDGCQFQSQMETALKL